MCASGFPRASGAYCHWWQRCVKSLRLEATGGSIKASDHAKVEGMTTIDDIKKAVSRLDPRDLAQFRAWFEAFDEAWFDQKIERDAKAGKLDELAEQALRDFRQGRAREI
jgi:hypothetical protein